MKKIFSIYFQAKRMNYLRNATDEKKKENLKLINRKNGNIISAYTIQFCCIKKVFQQQKIDGKSFSMGKKGFSLQWSSTAYSYHHLNHRRVSWLRILISDEIVYKTLAKCSTNLVRFQWFLYLRPKSTL